MDRDKLLDRLRKLLALATSPNEHEAALASAQAQALMVRYQLTLADVERTVYVQRQVTLPVWWQHADRRVSATYLIALVASESGCVAGENLDRSCAILGEPLLAEGAELLLQYLLEVIETLTVRTYREREAVLTDPVLGRHPVLDEPGDRVRWTKGYIFGVMEAITRRMHAAREATVSEVADGSGTALIQVSTALTKQRDQLVAKLEARGSKMSAAPLRVGTVPAGAVRDGLQDGAQVSLTAPKGRLDG